MARQVNTEGLLSGSAGNLLRAEEGADTIRKIMTQAGVETKRVIQASNNLSHDIGEWYLKSNKDIESYMKEVNITELFTLTTEVNQHGQGSKTSALRILAKSLQSHQDESDSDKHTNDPNDAESQRQKGKEHWKVYSEIIGHTQPKLNGGHETRRMAEMMAILDCMQGDRVNIVQKLRLLLVLQALPTHTKNQEGFIKAQSLITKEIWALTV